MKKILKAVSKAVQKVLPRKMYDNIKDTIMYLVSSKHRTYRRDCMYKKAYGRLNPDKTFYVCRLDQPEIGILSAYLYWLNEIIEVDRMGYIPVFDLKNNYLPLVQDEDKAHLENAWDYYFDTTNCSANLDEVYRSKNVILGWKNGSNPHAISWQKKILKEDEIIKFNRLAIKYMDFSPEIKGRAKAILSGVPKDRKVLGMALRAGFLRGELLGIEIFRGHPKQRNLEETIELARDMIRKWHCDYIFISVEDREWLEAFKKSFGEKCLWVERELGHYFEHEEPVTDVKKIMQEFERVTVRKKTIDYLTEVCVLSQCDDLFGSLSSGMTVAQIMNGGKYEHINVGYNGSI